MTPLFMSTFMYAACKVVGAEHWTDVLKYELDHLDESEWPGFRTMGQASRLSELKVHVDASTYITRARCVAAGHFLRKAGAPCDVWLTVDDDVYADQSVIEKLVALCRLTRGLVALPYLNRDGGSMTFRRVKGPTEFLLPGMAVRTVDRVGMGLVALHRDFVTTLDAGAVHFEEQYPGIFLEGVQDVDEDGHGTWVGEDYWLCSLAERAGLPMHVLLDAVGTHAGLTAKLDLDGQIQVQGEAAANKLARGIAAAARKFTEEHPTGNGPRDPELR